MPPGDYTFRAVGVTTGTRPESSSIALPIKIWPPFWQRAWFWPLVTVLASCLLGGIAFTFARMRARRKLHEIRFQHSLERDRTRIARDMHDDLGSRITGLTTTAALAKREMAHDPAKSPSHLDRLVVSARELVIAMDDLVWAVDPAHDTLDQFGTHLSRLGDEVFHSSEVRYRSSIPAELPDIHLGSNLRHHLALPVKESLHNILKHAGTR